MIFVYMLVYVLSRLTSSLGVGGILFSVYYLLTTGSMLWIISAVLLIIFIFITNKIYTRSEIFVRDRVYRRELSSLIQTFGGLRARVTYFLMWLSAAMALLAALAVVFYYVAREPLSVIVVCNLLAFFSIGMIKLAERAEQMVRNHLPEQHDHEV